MKQLLIVTVLPMVFAGQAYAACDNLPYSAPAELQPACPKAEESTPPQAQADAMPTKAAERTQREIATDSGKPVTATPAFLPVSTPAQ